MSQLCNFSENALVKMRKQAIRGSDLYKGGRTRCWFRSHVFICNKPSVDDAIRFRCVCFANREGQSPAIQLRMMHDVWILSIWFDGLASWFRILQVGFIPQVDKPLPIWFKNISNRIPNNQVKPPTSGGDSSTHQNSFQDWRFVAISSFLLEIRYHYQPEMHRLELRLQAPQE